MSINPFYLFALLKTSHFRNWTDRLATATMYPTFSESDFMNLPIPIPPSKLEKAVEFLIKKSQEEKEKATQLYETANHSLLHSLNLTSWFPPTRTYHVQNLAFITESTTAVIPFSIFQKSDRLDAEYWEPAVAEVEAKIRAVGAVHLGSLCAAKPQRGVQPAFEEGGSVFVIASKAVKPVGLELDLEECVSTDFHAQPRNAKARILRGDVLLNGTGRGTLGRAGVYTSNAPALADNHVTILRLREGVNPFFVSLFLNSVAGRIQSEKWQTGSSGQLELYPFQIEQFLVPNLPQSIQDELGGLVRDSLAARQESKQLIERARQAVEIFIEQDEASALQYLNTV